MSLAAISKLYDLAEQNHVVPHILDHAALRAFAKNLRTFEKQLGANAQDDYWQTRLRTLKRYRFQICATPLGFDDRHGHYHELLGRLEQSLSTVAVLYPDYAEAARMLVASAVELTKRDDNPVLEALEKLAPSEGAVLMCETRFTEPTEILLSQHLRLRHLKVRAPAQLRRNETFTQLVMIGPMRWFPDHVMTAPKARMTHQLRFGFLGDGWTPSTELLRPIKQHINVSTRLQAAVPEEIEPIPADELLPLIDWEAITRPLLRRSHNENAEFVDALLVHLAGDHAVFLESEGNELVLDPSGTDPIRSAKVTQLHTGLYLIVRERGQGAYIVPIANQLLGERAQRCRDIQEEWKRKLRSTVAVHGMAHVLNKLKLYGARAATHTNVRNWMSLSERKIRPRYREDFAAIMALLNMPERTEDYWKNAKMINQAHHRAGMEMKRQLLNAVRSASLDELSKRGYQSFTIGEYQTNLTAYRVHNISKTTYQVPIEQLGELLSPEDETWHE